MSMSGISIIQIILSSIGLAVDLMIILINLYLPILNQVQGIDHLIIILGINTLTCTLSIIIQTTESFTFLTGLILMFSINYTYLSQLNWARIYITDHHASIKYGRPIHPILIRDGFLLEVKLFIYIMLISGGIILFRSYSASFFGLFLIYGFLVFLAQALMIKYYKEIYFMLYDLNPGQSTHNFYKIMSYNLVIVLIMIPAVIYSGYEIAFHDDPFGTIYVSSLVGVFYLGIFYITGVLRFRNRRVFGDERLNF